MMALTLRPTGLGAGIDKDRQDFTIFSGGWAVGRIYETRGGPDHLRWFWSLTVDPPMTRSDRVATLEEAKAQLQKSETDQRVRARPSIPVKVSSAGAKGGHPATNGAVLPAGALRLDWLAAGLTSATLARTCDRRQ